MTPDIRPEIVLEITAVPSPSDFPQVIADDVQNTYLDRVALDRFQNVMKDRVMSDDESGDFVSFLDSKGENFDLDHDDDEDDEELASRSSDSRVPMPLLPTTSVEFV